MFHAQVVPFPEPACSLSSCRLFIRLKGFVGSIDCGFGVRGVHFRQRGNGLEGCGVGHIECGTFLERV